MEVKSSLNLYSGLQFENNLSEFPENPKIGTIILKDNKIYIYELVNNVPDWHFIDSNSSGSSSDSFFVYIYEQEEESDTWVINHNIGNTTYFYNIVTYDGRHVLANAVSDSDGNTITVYFASPISGKIILLFINNIPIVYLTNNKTSS